MQRLLSLLIATTATDGLLDLPQLGVVWRTIGSALSRGLLPGSFSLGCTLLPALRMLGNQPTYLDNPVSGDASSFTSRQN